LRFGDDPIVVNRKRVQRLMRVHGLQVKVKRYQASGRVPASGVNWVPAR
jgi:hypothetical protein